MLIITLVVVVAVVIIVGKSGSTLVGGPVKSGWKWTKGEDRCWTRG